MLFFLFRSKKEDPFPGQVLLGFGTLPQNTSVYKDSVQSVLLNFVLMLVIAASFGSSVLLLTIVKSHFTFHLLQFS